MFPIVLGQQTTTLTLGSMFGCVLSPNTFTATAKVVYLFTIPLATGGVPLNVYFKATSSGFLDSYLFLNGALTTENNPTVFLPLVYPIEIVNAGYGGGVTLQPDRATIALQIVDCVGTLMTAAQVTITQSSSNVGDLVTDLAPLYSAQFSPSLMTLLALNVPAGQTTVTAKVGQYSLRPTTITAVANALNVVRLAP
jgi:hypothetical protein